MISTKLTDPEEKLLFENSGGERVYRKDTSIFVKLPPERSTLTTSWLGGGYREDLECIFNHQIPYCNPDSHSLEGGSIPAYIGITAKSLGFDPGRSSGLLTAANMDHVAIVTHSFRDIEVTAIITGGIEVNGGRAGDPASFYEEDGEVGMIGGTINTMLLVNANLPPGTMARAIITATEAKTVALQQLMAPSRYSSGIATGSGTDMVALVADRSSSNTLTNAGKHSKLGELIGRCVIEATTLTLSRQSDLTPLSQRDMLIRLERFDIEEKDFWKAASSLEGDNRKTDFYIKLRQIAKNPVLVGATGAVLHTMDEVSWGLIPEIAGKRTALAIMKSVPGLLNLSKEAPLDDLLRERDTIADNWVRIVAWCARNIE